MKLYIENEQSLTYSKTDSPKFNRRDDWYSKKVIIDGKEIKVYYSYKYQCPPVSDANILGISGRGYYLYFQLDSQWYKMDAFQEFHYLGKHCLDVIDYIDQKGTFTTKRMNKRLDGVELSDIAQIELLSKSLRNIMKNINKYNPYIEVRVQESKLFLVNKSQGDYIIKDRSRS